MSYTVTKKPRTKKNLQLFIASTLLLGSILLGNWSSGVVAACSIPSDKGIVTMSVNVGTSGSYRVWTRMYAPSSSNNSYLLQIDEQLCNTTVGDAGITPNSWTWVDWRDGDTNNKINVSLSAGQHTIKLAGSEGDVQIDTVLLLADTSCIPTGVSGTNCTGGSASAGPGSSEASGADDISSSDQASQTKADPDPIVNNVSDVPLATISAIANPSSIPRVIRGSYGWLIGLVLLAIIFSLAGLLWYRRRWIIQKFQVMGGLLLPKHKFAGHSHGQSSTQSTKVIHPTKGKSYD